MSKNKSDSKRIDLTGFSDDDINSLYRDAQRGVRRHGYDDSHDVTVDYDPSPQDAIKAAKAVSSDWKGGAWDDVRDAVKHGYSEEDLIHKMRGAVSNEYLTRMEGKVDANTNREIPKPEAPKVEAKKEEEYKPRPKVEVELESIRPFEPESKLESKLESKPENKAEGQIDGFAGSTWNPDGGTEAPGLAEYGKAKEKAQSFKAGNSFEGGAYGAASVKGASAYGGKPAATDGVAGGSNADPYGNVPAADMDAEHKAEQLKNSHLTRVQGLV